VASSSLQSSAADLPALTKPPLTVLLVTGGGYHDYQRLTPYLTNQISRLANCVFDARFGLDVLGSPKFADPYDMVVYHHCDDEAPEAYVDNALAATRAGKPTVMLHCAVHAFRKSPKISEWEACCGMRSKVHDPYGPFTILKIDPKSPITRFLPDDWTTAGDELYQTISIDPQSHPLLKTKSPKDGREHIVAWTYRYGQGRVFATTLGHDLKMVATPEYIRLLGNGLLWACGKLTAEGEPAPGYAAARVQP
jgi:type 1 glutamine amidotransferase